MGKTILYIACSADGYIAKQGDDLSFLDAVHTEDEDYGYNAFIESVNTIIIGRRTYDWVINQGIEFPHPEIKTYVLTREDKKNFNNIIFYNGNIKFLIEELKSKNERNIFIEGGSEIIFLLMKDHLIDEYIISIIPVLLGSGIRLFKEGFAEQNLEMISHSEFKTGLIQLHYKAVKN